LDFGFWILDSLTCNAQAYRILALYAEIQNPKSEIQNRMTCSRCKVKMAEQKRSYHKQRKWVCPQCGAARMQSQRPRPPKTSRGAAK